jgi:hypothetical protein
MNAKPSIGRLGDGYSTTRAGLSPTFAEHRLRKHNKRYDSGSVQLRCELTPLDSTK